MPEYVNIYSQLQNVILMPIEMPQCFWVLCNDKYEHGVTE